MQPDLAGLDAPQHVLEALDVHRLVQAVVHRLAQQHVVGHLERSGDVLLAADLFGKVDASRSSAIMRWR